MKLKDVIECYISGDWGNKSPTERENIAVSCIRGADIMPIRNYYFTEIPTRYISADSLASKGLKEGDIVIEKSGGSPTQSTGRVVYVSKELLQEKQNIVCTNFCVAIRIKKEWDPFYIYNYLLFVYDLGVFFNFEGKTSGLKNLDTERAFDSIPIHKVDIDAQRTIASAIRSIEDKIAINTSLCNRLEQSLCDIYNYYFNNTQISHDGWSIKRLGDIADIMNGATPDTSSPVNYGGDIVWITPKDLSDQNCKFVYYGERNITQEGYDSCSTKLLPAWSILMSSRAPIGLLSISMVEVCTNQGFKSFILKDKELVPYMYYYLKYNIKSIEQLGSGTTFKEVSRDSMVKYEVLLPTSTQIRIFNEAVLPIFKEQFSIIRETDILKREKQHILPLIMNGQAKIL